MLRVVLIVLVVAVTVYGLVEAALADAGRVRNMPKWLWIAAIVCLPGAGALAWFLLGRPGRGGLGPRTAGKPIAPDDDPDFLRGL